MVACTGKRLRSIPMVWWCLRRHHVLWLDLGDCQAGETSVADSSVRNGPLKSDVTKVKTAERRRIGRFAKTYGWRACALPILMITALALLNTVVVD